MSTDSHTLGALHSGGDCLKAVEKSASRLQLESKRQQTCSMNNEGYGRTATLLTDADKLERYRAMGLTEDKSMGEWIDPLLSVTKRSADKPSASTYSVHSVGAPHQHAATASYSNGILSSNNSSRLHGGPVKCLETYGAGQEAYFATVPKPSAAAADVHSRRYGQQLLPGKMHVPTPGLSGTSFGCHHTSYSSVAEREQPAAASASVKSSTYRFSSGYGSGDHLDVNRRVASYDELKRRSVQLTSEYRCACGSTTSDDVVRLRAQLGAVEYELREVQKTNECQVQERDKRIDELLGQVTEKDRQVNDWSDKFVAVSKELEALKAQCRNRDLYLQELPTRDEHKSNVETMKRLNEELSECRRAAEQRDRQIHDLTRRTDSRSALIAHLELRQSELLTSVTTLEKSNAELVTSLSRRADVVQLESLKQEIEQLRADLEKANSCLSADRKMWTERERLHDKSLVQLKEGLERESQCVFTLSEEIKAKDDQLVSCQQSLKRVSIDQADLMEICLRLEDELSRVNQSQTSSQPDSRLVSQLITELELCEKQLRTLVLVCRDLIDGEEPNVCALLGLKDSGVNEPSCPSASGDSQTLSGDWLKSRLGAVKQLSRDIDVLRDNVSTMVAEDMGRRLTCSQQ